MIRGWRLSEMIWFSSESQIRRLKVRLTARKSELQPGGPPKPDPSWTLGGVARATSQSCRNGRFGKRRFVPCGEQAVLTKIGEILIVHFTHKSKGFCRSDLEIDENDGNGVSPKQNDRLPKAPFWKPPNLTSPNPSPQFLRLLVAISEGQPHSFLLCLFLFQPRTPQGETLSALEAWGVLGPLEKFQCSWFVS